VYKRKNKIEKDEERDLPLALITTINSKRK